MVCVGRRKMEPTLVKPESDNGCHEQEQHNNESLHHVSFFSEARPQPGSASEFRSSSARTSRRSRRPAHFRRRPPPGCRVTGASGDYFSPVPGRLLYPAPTRASTASTRKMTKKTFATSRASLATPPNPRKPEIRANTPKITARRSMVEFSCYKE